MASGAVIVIDGSHGEGGGALVRTAIAMSALTQQPLRIINVRGATRYAGLDPEDIAIIKALAISTQAETIGVEIGSKTFSFLPTRRAKGINGTLESPRHNNGRGSNALIVLNTLLPVLALTGMYSSISIEGETYGSNSLCYDAFSTLTLPALKKVGLYAYPTLMQAGFGRESAGIVSMDIEPCALHGIEWLDRGRFLGIQATLVCSNLPISLLERAEAHLKQLAKHANMPVNIELLSPDSHEPGFYVTLSAHYEKGFGGSTALGSRSIRAESVIQGAFDDLVDWQRTESTVDPFLADQMLLPCVLAEGPTTFKVSVLTSRFLTTVWVVKQFTPIHITVRGSEGSAGMVSIHQ